MCSITPKRMTSRPPERDEPEEDPRRQEARQGHLEDLPRQVHRAQQDQRRREARAAGRTVRQYQFYRERRLPSGQCRPRNDARPSQRLPRAVSTSSGTHPRMSPPRARGSTRTTRSTPARRCLPAFLRAPGKADLAEFINIIKAADKDLLFATAFKLPEDILDALLGKDHDDVLRSAFRIPPAGSPVSTPTGPPSSPPPLCCPMAWKAG